jgi:hypothetical protein
VPRRVTQLTIQQAEVIWMGSWLDPANGLMQAFSADAVLTVDETQPQDPDAGAPVPTPQPFQITRPDIVMVMQDVFKFEERGEDENGKVLGDFGPTGMPPYYTNRLKNHGFKLPPQMFMKGRNNGSFSTR